MKRDVDWFLVSFTQLGAALLVGSLLLFWADDSRKHERDMACIQKAGVPCDQIAKRCVP